MLSIQAGKSHQLCSFKIQYQINWSFKQTNVSLDDDNYKIQAREHFSICLNSMCDEECVHNNTKEL